MTSQLLKTLGWIISGAANKIVDEEIRCNVIYEEVSLNKQLQAFWELEELHVNGSLSTEEEMAREIFKRTVRLDNGRLMVDLPFKMDPHDRNCFGESYSIAKRRYIAVQSDLQKHQSSGKHITNVFKNILHLGIWNWPHRLTYHLFAYRTIQS